MSTTWHDYFSVTNLPDALRILAERRHRARIVAGATDILLELERGVRTGIDTLIDITQAPGLDQITLDEDGFLHLGPLVTHNQCVASKLVRELAFPLAQAAWEVGVPQIRNRGTVAGNLITASPANDTITPLMALNARLTLASVRGERSLPLAEFYSGVRRTIMQPDEMLVDIVLPAMRPSQRGAFIKLGLRRAQAISLVNAAVVLTFSEGKAPASSSVVRAAITLGAVAPVIIHAAEAETYLQGQVLDESVISKAAELAMQAAHPIDDVRSSADYRREMVRVCIRRVLRSLADNSERDEFPAAPVFLWGKPGNKGNSGLEAGQSYQPGMPIVTRINGQPYTFTTGQEKSLLHLLREEAGLVGTKEGCAEGECGACTVYLDGTAVMSCLVPAGRAHGAEITTIEGLGTPDHLHPVQRAFIQEGAVQCGYCTPGLIMSSAKLLEEQPHPTSEQIRQAISGNLCRCTGYYQVIKAVESAAAAVSTERETTQIE